MVGDLTLSYHSGLQRYASVGHWFFAQGENSRRRPAHGASASVAYFGFIDTQMVRDAFDDPAAEGVEDLFPKFVTKRLQPADAGAAIVDGIERRVPRIIRPRWWRAWSVLRGVVNPLLDAAVERNDRFRDVVREGERQAAAETEVEAAANAR